MTRVEAKERLRRELHPNVRTLRGVRVFVVGTLPVRVELRTKQVVVDSPPRASERCVAVRRTEVPTICAETQFGNASGSVTRPHLDDAGHCIGAVQSAL